MYRANIGDELSQLTMMPLHDECGCFLETASSYQKVSPITPKYAMIVGKRASKGNFNHIPGNF